MVLKCSPRLRMNLGARNEVVLFIELKFVSPRRALVELEKIDQLSRC
jgi:hypothetical protein